MVHHDMSFAFGRAVSFWFSCHIFAEGENVAGNKAFFHTAAGKNGRWMSHRVRPVMSVDQNDGDRAMAKQYRMAVQVLFLKYQENGAICQVPNLLQLWRSTVARVPFRRVTVQVG